MEALNTMNARDRRVFSEHFAKGRSLQEIGDGETQFGGSAITRERVRQLSVRAMKGVRDHITAKKGPEFFQKVLL